MIDMYINDEIEDGDVARYALGLMYGRYVPADLEGAIDLLEKVSDEDCCARYLLGCAKLLGLGTEQDVEGGVGDVRMARAMGSSAAALKIAEWRIEGSYMPRDLRMAETAIQQADDTPYVHFLMGRLAEAQGKSSEGFMRKAFKACGDRRHARNPDILFLKGYLYEHGLGTDKDSDKAAEMYVAAAKASHPSAAEYAEQVSTSGTSDAAPCGFPAGETVSGPLSVSDMVVGFDTEMGRISDAFLARGDRKTLAERLGLEVPLMFLLYGPPGNGKSLFCRALGKATGSHVIFLDANNTLDRYVGSEQAAITAAFKEARNHPRSIIFMDEFDSLASRRDEESPKYSRDMVNSILMEVDGIRSAPRGNTVIIVAATNKPWLIDEAMMRSGRLEAVYVGLPDSGARARILHIALAGRAVEDDIDLDDVVSRTEGYSGADVVKIVKDAALIAFRRCVDADDDGGRISNADIQAALEQSKSTVDMNEVEKLKAWGARHAQCKPAKVNLVGYN